MATIYYVSRPIQTFAPVRLALSLFGHCRAALIEWHERQKIAASLLDLSDRELHDIGISRGEIDYVASNRSADPRGAVDCRA
jgi:uncharacterized protein YjiS (DUF1127 family)